MNFSDLYNELANHEDTILIEERGDNPDYETADPNVVNRFNFWLWYTDDSGAVHRQAVGIAVFGIRGVDERAEWYDQIPVPLVPDPVAPGPSAFYQQTATEAMNYQTAHSEVESIHLNHIVESDVTRKFAILSIWSYDSENSVTTQSRVFVWKKDNGTLGISDLA